MPKHWTARTRFRVADHIAEEAAQSLVHAVRPAALSMEEWRRILENRPKLTRDPQTGKPLPFDYAAWHQQRQPTREESLLLAELAELVVVRLFERLAWGEPQARDAVVTARAQSQQVA